MPTPYIMIKTEVDVTEIRYIHSIWLRRWDLNHMTFGLSLRARLRRVSFCTCGKPLFQNSRFGRHRLPKRHAHGVLTSLTQRATLVVLITRQKKKQPDGLFLFCLVAE